MTKRMSYNSWFIISLLCISLLALPAFAAEAQYDAATLEGFKRDAAAAGADIGRVKGAVAAKTAAETTAADVGAAAGTADGKASGTIAARDVILGSMEGFGQMFDTHHKVVESIAQHSIDEGKRRAEKASLLTGTQAAASAAAGATEDAIRDFYTKYEKDTAAAVAQAVSDVLDESKAKMRIKDQMLEAKVHELTGKAARQAAVERAEVTNQIRYNQTIHNADEQSNAAAHNFMSVYGPKVNKEAQDGLKAKAENAAQRISQEELVKLLENENTRQTREKKMLDLSADAGTRRSVEKFVKDFTPQVLEQYVREGRDFGRDAATRVADAIANSLVQQSEPVIQQNILVSAATALEDNVPKVEDIMQPILKKRTEHVLKLSDAIGAEAGKITGTEAAIESASQKAVNVSTQQVDNLKPVVDHAVRIAALKTSRKWEDFLGRLPSRTKKQADQLASQSGVRRGITIATDVATKSGTAESKRLADDIRSQLSGRLQQQLSSFNLKFDADLQEEQNKEKTSAVNAAQAASVVVAKKTAKSTATNQARITTMATVRDYAMAATDDIVSAATNAATQAVKELAALSVQDVESKKSQVESQMRAELNRLVTMVASSRGSERARILAKKSANQVAQQLLGNYTVSLVQMVNQLASAEGAKTARDEAGRQAGELMQQFQTDVAALASSATRDRVYDILAPWVFQEQELTNEVKTDRKKARAMHTATTILYRLLENSNNLNAAANLGTDAGQRIGYDKGGLYAKSTMINKYLRPDSDMLRKAFALTIAQLHTEIRKRKAQQKQMLFRLEGVRNSYESAIIEIRGDARKYVSDVETEIKNTIEGTATKLLAEVRAVYGENSEAYTTAVKALVPRDVYETDFMIKNQLNPPQPAPVVPAPAPKPAAPTVVVVAPAPSSTAPKPAPSSTAVASSSSVAKSSSSSTGVASSSSVAKSSSSSTGVAAPSSSTGVAAPSSSRSSSSSSSVAKSSSSSSSSSTGVSSSSSSSSVAKSSSSSSSTGVASSSSSSRTISSSSSSSSTGVKKL